MRTRAGGLLDVAVVDGLRRLDRYGPPDGPVVILVHGAVVNGAAMMPLALELAVRANVWVPDLPGHGSRRDEPFTLTGALTDLAALLEDARAASNGAPVVVAGDSLGGYLALACAARTGVELAAVIAGGCSFPMHGWWSLGATLTNAPASALARLAGDDAVTRVLLRAFVALGGDAATARAIQERGLRLAARDESIRALRAFDVTATLRAIRCPVLLVNGAKDIPIVWMAARFARIARFGRAVAIAGSVHGVMTFAPRPVASYIFAAIERAT